MPRAIRPRRIVGVQVHHSVNLGDASRFAANALTAIEATLQKREDPELRALADDLLPIVRRIGAARTAASSRLSALHETDSRTFRLARDGHRRWPDERSEGFVPRCTCHDVCLYHDVRRGMPDDCNCGPCPAHDSDAGPAAAA